MVDRIQHVQSSPSPEPPTSVLPMVMIDMLYSMMVGMDVVERLLLRRVIQIDVTTWINVISTR